MMGTDIALPRSVSEGGARPACHAAPARARGLAPARTRGDLVMLTGLMVGAAFVFFWNLTASGYANEFYSAAAQAASKSWEAFLWGSLDAGNAITVDKPPASIWLMGLSVRLLGLSSFSILLPQALMGVGSTYVIYATTRRYWGNHAGIIAGALFVITPVAALMFRFNNPDALLVLLMLGASAATLRGLEEPADRAGSRARTRWVALAGACVGLGFLTKQLQVMLIVPGLAAALFACSPTPWPRRLADGAVAIASIAVSAGWWVLLTVVVPAGSRPYFGGSQTNSFIELTFSYNGLGRLTGEETGSVVPGGGAQGGMWGETGIGRLLTSDFGDQITWFALAALAGIVVGVLAARAMRVRGRGLSVGSRAPEMAPAGSTGAFSREGVLLIDRARLRMAFVIVFGSWLVITWLTFSFMAGIFHSYYTVALAPAVAMLAAVFLAGAWELRERAGVRAAVVAVGAVSAAWAFALIERSGSYGWLGWAVLVIGVGGSIVAGAALMVAVPDGSGRVPALAWVALGSVALSLVAGPAVWTVATIATGHTGSIVSAGPGGGMGGGPGGGARGAAGAAGSSAASVGAADGGAMGSQGSSSAGTGSTGSDGSGSASSSSADGAAGTSASPMAGGPGGGGLLGGGTASDAIVQLLTENASGYRWAAATTGSQNAASYQLASELAVMAIGGFNGSDPAPTLEEFKAYVEQGLVRYYISGGGMGGSQMGGSDAASEIAAWVAENFEATTVDGVTVYDLSTGAAS
ncbi:MAG: glycosyltransferase family 39 protein [Collinsella sp.]|nr:glycosyltransferase family 39 protein [Collinsella sp.]